MTDALLAPLLSALKTQLQVEAIEIREILHGGFSDSVVALVDIVGDRLHGSYIAKTTPLAAREGDNEIERYQDAQELNPFEGHFPELIESLETQDAALMLLRLAGGSRLSWRPLTSSLELWGNTYSRIAELLWMPHLSVWQGMETGPEFLRSILPYQLSVETGGRVSENLRLLSPDIISATHFGYLDEQLPNPLLYATGSSDLRFRFIYGPSHGDLHGGNIFARANIEGDAVEVSLIDFAKYRSRAPLFFDSLYLELSVLLDRFEGLGEERWWRLVEAIAQPRVEEGSLPPEERSWLLEIQKGRTTLLTRALETYPDRHDDFCFQILLAGVGAGLAFLNKRRRSGAGGGLTSEQYRQALCWAGAFLRRFISFTHEEVKRTRVAILADPKAGTQVAERDWQELGGLDRDGLNILVLPPNWQSIQERMALVLEIVDWNLVVDFSASESPLPSTGRRLWPGSGLPSGLFFRRGRAWYFANGLEGLTGAAPQPDLRSWRRLYWRELDNLLNVLENVPFGTDIRVVVVGEGFEESQLQLVLHTLDARLGGKASRIALAGGAYFLDPTLDLIRLTISALEEKLRLSGDAAIATAVGLPTLPQRSDDGVLQVEVELSTISRWERDLTIVYPQRATSLLRGRRFGVDFRRGLRIEWAELAHDLDVEREDLSELLNRVTGRLDGAANATINLLHEPSAGGTTLALRIAWTIKDRNPVVVLEQYNFEETAEVLNELYLATKLPVLIIIEAEKINESERENLLGQLRDMNVRSVFLWVARHYDQQKQAPFPATLSDAEAELFLEAYSEQLEDEARLAALRRLTERPRYPAERSPFFYGLTAFGDKYAGLDKLLDEVTKERVDTELDLLRYLALVSAFSSEGFPERDFRKLMQKLRVEGPVVPASSPFLVASNGYIRIPHRLMAELTLRKLARNPVEWQADISLVARSLLRHLVGIRHDTGGAIKRMVETLFVTRDTQVALEHDVSGRPRRTGRFSPLIEQVRGVHQARGLLRMIYTYWPEEPHFAIHYVRHLLYENPQEIERAIGVANQAESSNVGERDGSVIHAAGMAYRFRMENSLRVALDAGTGLKAIQDGLKEDYELAVGRFEISRALQPESEYSDVALIQTATILLEGAMRLSGFASVAEFLKVPGHRWFTEVFTLAEERIGSLRTRQPGGVSTRAEQVVARWSRLCGNMEGMVSTLRVLVHRRDDSESRRALIDGIWARYRRRWRAVPQSEIRSIVAMAERNILSSGVRSSDVRRWLNAYRCSNTFDPRVVVERMHDWHSLERTAIEPVFYLFVFNALIWFKSNRQAVGFAREASQWLELCKANRPFGRRTWSYEWLESSAGELQITHFAELGFEPSAAVRHLSPNWHKEVEYLARLTGRLTNFRGPQSAYLDLSAGIRAHVTPGRNLSRDDLGRTVEAYISFSYDGLIGWDPRLTDKAD